MAGLQDESREVAIGIRRDCLAVRTRLINRVLTRMYDDALRPLGVTANQLSMLAVVVERGSGGLRPGEIATQLQMDKSTVSRTVERMEAHGWIRVNEGRDARTQEVVATTIGKRLLRRALPAWTEAQRNVTDLLGRGTVNVLAKAGGRLMQ